MQQQSITFPENKSNDTKHNTTHTQIQSWAIVKSSGQRVAQAEYIVNILNILPYSVCCRDLEEMTGVRASSLTRILNDLKSCGIITVKKESVSPYSGRLVEFYQINKSL